MDQSLRKKYWRIYFGDDKFTCLSDEFASAELKRLSNLTQRLEELNNEQIKQSSRYQELNLLNRITTNIPQQPSSEVSTTPFLQKFRRGRSNSSSIPDKSNLESLTEHRSFEALCHTPLCKPPTITVTNYS